jgi:hypothetical protein
VAEDWGQEATVAKPRKPGGDGGEDPRASRRRSEVKAPVAKPPEPGGDRR